ncbi:MAG TPA: ATP phosphoribosyltransferase regulatory subunit [Rhizomicrobium sp.]|jgi:ATP phosphoribosyltransferase regulatory subunit
MAGFPTYNAALLYELEEQASSVLTEFAQKHYSRVEPAVLQPAEIFLERSGEEIRRRTFAFTDPSGHELCLRPELTIPVCRMHVEQGGKFPARLCYNGLVFRHQPSEPERPTQFYQAGAELLGFPNEEAGDIEILSLAVESLRAAGLAGFDMRIGDIGLFATLINALEVPVQWRARLKRHFWRAGYFEDLVARLSQGKPSERQQLFAHLGTLPEAEARAAFEGLLDVQGGQIQGGRSREEIIDRLIEQAAEAAAVRLDPRIADTLTRFLAVTGPAHAAFADIRALSRSLNGKLDKEVAALETRVAALEKLNVDPANITFTARFGRNMEYYTGFVFEFWSRDSEGEVQVAGGGRYDNLLENFGAPMGTPAVGFVIRTERLLAARRETGKRV